MTQTRYAEGCNSGRMPILDPDPRGVDFLCSAEGLFGGFHSTGCRITVDSDTTAEKAFSRNLAGLPSVLSGDRGDLRTLDHKNTFGPVALDTVIGGPHRQAYSRTGHANFVSLSDQGFKENPCILPL